MHAVLAILLATFSLLVSFPPTLRASPSVPDDRALLDIADSLLVARRGDSALVLLAPAIERARTTQDQALLAQLLVRYGAIHTWLNDAVRAEGPIREALAIADAQGDSATACHALRWLAAALSTAGRTAESAVICERLQPLAHAMGFREDEGQALMLTAFSDLLTGNLARAQAEYRESIEMFREVGSTFWELWALTGLARVFDARADYVGARACLLEILERSRATENPFSEANALNNLGTLEYRVGDPPAAAAYWEQALALNRAYGAKAALITGLTNLSLANLLLRRLDTASALLDTAYAIADSLGLGEHRANVLLLTATLRLEQDRATEAAGLSRRLLGSSGISVKQRTESLMELANALARMDSIAEARTLIENELETRGRSMSFNVRVNLELQLGQLLIDDGRPADVPRRMRAIIPLARTSGLTQQQNLAWTLGARAFHAAGDADSALAWYDEAARLWEVRRSVPADPEWRERFARDAYWIAGGWATLQLGHALRAPPAERRERLHAAFDRMQRFKSRTLAERMQGPGPEVEPFTSPASTLDALQTSALTSNELLIDFVPGTEALWFFAVSRDSLRAVRIAGELQDIHRRASLLRDLVGSPPQAPDEDTNRSAARALGGRLLAGIEDLVASHDRLIFCLEGPLHGIPPGLLASPGNADLSLLDTHEVFCVPSAEVFLRIRRSRDASRMMAHAAVRAAHVAAIASMDSGVDASRGDSSGSRRILAVVGTERPDGRLLRGTRAEVEMLARSFTGVDVRRGGGRADAAAALLSAAYQVIHVAAHTAVFDQRPWQSGIFLGTGPTSQDPYLRAVTIAGLRLPARLAVLSACESAGGELLANEGVLGLSTAFMSAGVPCVVASLWPVDDAATARLMDLFYRHLAAGETAVAALRAAQIGVRSEGRWRHPFYWAGFVLIGDGTATVALERRYHGMPLAIGLLLAVLLVSLALTRRRLHHSAVTRADSGSLTS